MSEGLPDEKSIVPGGAEKMATKVELLTDVYTAYVKGGMCDSISEVQIMTKGRSVGYTYSTLTETQGKIENGIRDFLSAIDRLDVQEKERLTNLARIAAKTIVDIQKGDWPNFEQSAKQLHLFMDGFGAALEIIKG